MLVGHVLSPLEISTLEIYWQEKEKLTTETQPFRLLLVISMPARFLGLGRVYETEGPSFWPPEFRIYRTC